MYVVPLKHVFHFLIKGGYLKLEFNCFYVDIITLIYTLYFSYNTWKILHFVLKRHLKLLKTQSY